MDDLRSRLENMDDIGRFVDTMVRKEDQENESSLRPIHFDDYIGQDAVKENLKIFIEAAKKRGEPLDHALFYGPPGLGKTTIAGIIAHEMHVNIKITTGPAIEKPGDMAAILNNLSPGDILFIDFAIDIMIGKGPAARSIRLDLPKFTLIGATTRAGALSAPLRDRFGMNHHMEYYKPEELAQIVKNSAAKLKIEIDDEGALEIARRSRGTPRLANRFLKRVRDFAEVRFDGKITLETARYALNQLNVDPNGLDTMDQKMLTAMMDLFGGGPVGLETLAASIGEDSGTIEDVCEPYLMQCGFIQRTPRGRVVTPYCLTYFHRDVPAENGQLKL